MAHTSWRTSTAWLAQSGVWCACVQLDSCEWRARTHTHAQAYHSCGSVPLSPQLGHQALTVGDHWVRGYAAVLEEGIQYLLSKPWKAGWSQKEMPDCCLDSLWCKGKQSMSVLQNSVDTPWSNRIPIILVTSISYSVFFERLTRTFIPAVQKMGVGKTRRRKWLNSKVFYSHNPAYVYTSILCVIPFLNSLWIKISSSLKI